MDRGRGTGAKDWHIITMWLSSLPSLLLSSLTVDLVKKIKSCVVYVPVQCTSGCVRSVFLVVPGNSFLHLREAIFQKITEFYEIISQTGGGDQSDFISLIQKC